jgi:hypothetical protein
MDHMLAIPPEVEEYVANASHYLAAASRLPPPKHNAAHILLPIIGWENIVLADKTLSAWATRTTIEARLKRDHAEKLQWVTPTGATEGILHVIVGPAGSGHPGQGSVVQDRRGASKAAAALSVRQSGECDRS